MNWRAVSAVIMPEAAISGRQLDAQVSGVPSAYNAKRMGDELSGFPPTGSSALVGVNAPPKKGDIASARQIDASMRGRERDNLYSMPRMMPARTGAMHEWPAVRKRRFKSPPVDIVSSPFVR
jgi:hypothetical protein